MNSKISLEIREYRQKIKDNFIGESVYASKKCNNDLSVRDMLNITRNGKIINEDYNNITQYDSDEEEKKFNNFFDDLNVHIEFIPLEIKGSNVFWGGVIDGVVQFVYKKTDDDETSGVEFNYLRDGYENNDSITEIVDRVKSYYDTFYKYWEQNLPENN